MVIKALGVFIAAILLFWFDGRALWKQQLRKDAIVSAMILFTAVVVSLVRIMKWGTPTPLYVVSWFFKPLSDLIRMLQ
ncbi:hypothetical protein [Paenibacillus puerhi]|uniref:hypothetical protein n=1 Tax=Paenibacillus puerhi TaxID=2692622 RepID=UPI0013588B2E|nr:hypothetical protein [Paenibacillus puerhi]